MYLFIKNKNFFRNLSKFFLQSRIIEKNKFTSKSETIILVLLTSCNTSNIAKLSYLIFFNSGCIYGSNKFV